MRQICERSQGTKAEHISPILREVQRPRYVCRERKELPPVGIVKEEQREVKSIRAFQPTSDPPTPLLVVGAPPYRWGQPWKTVYPWTRGWVCPRVPEVCRYELSTKVIDLKLMQVSMKPFILG